MQTKKIAEKQRNQLREETVHETQDRMDNVFLRQTLVEYSGGSGEKKEKQDKDDCTCSNANVAGTWGYTETGTVYLAGN
jgi:hypothetical protein